MAKHIVNTLHPFCENTTTKYIISISSMNITAWLNWSERFQNLSLLLQFQNKEVSLFFMLTIQTYMHTKQSWILQSQAVLTSQNIARCFADIVRLHF